MNSCNSVISTNVLSRVPKQSIAVIKELELGSNIASPGLIYQDVSNMIMIALL